LMQGRKLTIMLADELCSLADFHLYLALILWNLNIIYLVCCWLELSSVLVSLVEQTCWPRNKDIFF
jgi:hypothetical protein